MLTVRINLMFFAKKVSIVTHSGSFHSDDVFAVATLAILFRDQIKIERSRDPTVITNADFVLDVGAEYDFARKRFDHHQNGGAGERLDKIPYASFGLIWKHFGEKISGSKEIAEKFDRDFVRFIDAMDSGIGELKAIVSDVYPHTVSGVIFSFLPSWKDDISDMDRRFLEAVSFAKGLILRKIKVLKDESEGVAIVEKIYRQTEDKRIIILDRSYPWSPKLSEFKEPIFVVGPVIDEDGTGTWKVRAVRDNVYSFKNRKDLPVSWAGKMDKELQDITGVSDAVFCHNKLFIAVAKSKEGACKLAKLALEYQD